MRENPDDVMVETHRRVVVVTVDARELMVILFEAMMELPRPGATVAEALHNIRLKEPLLSDSLQRMAAASLEFIGERMAAAQSEGPLQ